MIINVNNNKEFLEAINNLPTSDEQTVIKLCEGRYEIKETINLNGKKILNLRAKKEKPFLQEA